MRFVYLNRTFFFTTGSAKSISDLLFLSLLADNNPDHTSSVTIYPFLWIKPAGLLLLWRPKIPAPKCYCKTDTIQDQCYDYNFSIPLKDIVCAFCFGRKSLKTAAFLCPLDCCTNFICSSGREFFFVFHKHFSLQMTKALSLLALSCSGSCFLMLHITFGELVRILFLWKLMPESSKSFAARSLDFFSVQAKSYIAQHLT